MIVWEEPAREETTAWRKESCSASVAARAACSLGGLLNSTWSILGMASLFGIKPAIAND